MKDFTNIGKGVRDPSSMRNLNGQLKWHRCRICEKMYESYMTYRSIDEHICPNPRCYSQMLNVKKSKRNMLAFF